MMDLTLWLEFEMKHLFTCCRPTTENSLLWEGKQGQSRSATDGLASSEPFSNTFCVPRYPFKVSNKRSVL